LHLLRWFVHWLEPCIILCKASCSLQKTLRQSDDAIKRHLPCWLLARVLSPSRWVATTESHNLRQQQPPAGESGSCRDRAVSVHYRAVRTLLRCFNAAAAGAEQAAFKFNAARGKRVERYAFVLLL